MTTRSYGQECPIARALDVLGERWTLLILRELMGGPRRYADLRADLPGIATNLLSERLRQLAADGLAEQVEVPPPVARTLYRLTDAGWRLIPPVLRSLAAVAALRPLPDAGDPTPLTGFLAMLAGFDSAQAAGLDEEYRVVVDGRVFGIGVRDGGLHGAAGDQPAAELRATARDLIALRGGAAPARELRGSEAGMARMAAVFAL